MQSRGAGIVSVIRGVAEDAFGKCATWLGGWFEPPPARSLLLDDDRAFEALAGLSAKARYQPAHLRQIETLEFLVHQFRDSLQAVDADQFLGAFGPVHRFGRYPQHRILVFRCQPYDHIGIGREKPSRVPCGSILPLPESSGRAGWPGRFDRRFDLQRSRDVDIVGQEVGRIDRIDQEEEADQFVRVQRLVQRACVDQLPPRNRFAGATAQLYGYQADQSGGGEKSDADFLYLG